MTCRVCIYQNSPRTRCLPCSDCGTVTCGYHRDTHCCLPDTRLDDLLAFVVFGCRLRCATVHHSCPLIPDLTRMVMAYLDAPVTRLDNVYLSTHLHEWHGSWMLIPDHGFKVVIRVSRLKAACYLEIRVPDGAYFRFGFTKDGHLGALFDTPSAIYSYHTLPEVTDHLEAYVILLGLLSTCLPVTDYALMTPFETHDFIIRLVLHYFAQQQRRYIEFLHKYPRFDSPEFDIDLRWAPCVFPPTPGQFTTKTRIPESYPDTFYRLTE